MNLLFFLTPKAKCAHIFDDDSVREALQRMELSGFTALPILSRDGAYCGTLTEGDLLWGLKNECGMDMKAAEQKHIMELPRRRDNLPVRVDTQMQDLLEKAVNQNFVPVVDDRGSFIGIVTRQSVLRYFQSQSVAAQTAPESSQKDCIF